jgi:hypothetical protein
VRWPAASGFPVALVTGMGNSRRHPGSRAAINHYLLGTLRIAAILAVVMYFDFFCLPSLLESLETQHPAVGSRYA